MIPSICTPASSHEIDRLLDTDSILDRNVRPPTPCDPFKQSGEQVLRDPPIPSIPLVPSAPPAMDQPETPVKVVTQRSRPDIPTTPSRENSFA